ncbi:MAG: glycine cleavage T C-terminal barrel domain-containing protein [Chloroflexota bacterium]
MLPDLPLRRRHRARLRDQRQLRLQRRQIHRLWLYGYLPVEYAAEGTEVEVEYFGVRHKAVVSAEPLYDPHMEKLKA